MDWHPLDTAPFNTPVLLWWNGRVITGKRVKPHRYSPEAFLAERMTEDGKPSHWMPRPTPPENQL